MPPHSVPLVIFSDFTCPFSYVMEAAVRRRAAEGDLGVEYRAWELFPPPDPIPDPEVPADWEEPLRAIAAEVDLEVAAQPFRPHTRKAHEAARFAADSGGDEGAFRSAIYDAYWKEGRDIGRIDVLVELGEAAGLDGVQLRIVLDIDRYAEAVASDRAAARRAGINGTPTLLIGRGSEKQVLIGAHPTAELDTAIARTAATGMKNVE